MKNVIRRRHGLRYLQATLEHKERWHFCTVTCLRKFRKPITPEFFLDMQVLNAGKALSKTTSRTNHSVKSVIIGLVNAFPHPNTPKQTNQRFMIVQLSR